MKCPLRGGGDSECTQHKTRSTPEPRAPGTKAFLQRAEELFPLFDDDKAGAITVEKLGRVAKEVGGDWAAKSPRRLKDLLECSEAPLAVSDAMRLWLSRTTPSRRSEEDLKKMIDEGDIDKDGTLIPIEFLNAISGSKTSATRGETICCHEQSKVT